MEALCTDLMPRFFRTADSKKYREKYHDAVRNNISFVMTSLECPFRCNFYACRKLMNGKYIAGTPESIVNELKTCLLKTRNTPLASEVIKINLTFDDGYQIVQI